MTQTSPITISVPEAGKMLGVGKHAAYEAVKRGQIPVIKVGNRLRVSVAAIERMIQQGSNLAAAAPGSLAAVR